MNRRNCLASLIAGSGTFALSQAGDARPIQLHVDLSVDPAKEDEMLRIFHSEFRPAASKQPGFKDLQMLKLRSTLAGIAPPGSNYRFVLTFESEQQRLKWVETPIHKKLWPKIEATLRSKDYTVLLYDTV
jgi:heme-degrading monooxygenase HmoA